MARYKWDSPLEWLAEKARSWDEAKLYNELLNLARRHDSDTLQDEYQSEMSADDYFRDLDKKYPVLFVLDEHGEATHTLFFCSEKCRRIHETDDPVSSGESADWIEGTVCDECGGEL